MLLVSLGIFVVAVSCCLIVAFMLRDGGFFLQSNLHRKNAPDASWAREEWKKMIL